MSKHRTRSGLQFLLFVGFAFLAAGVITMPPAACADASVLSDAAELSGPPVLRHRFQEADTKNRLVARLREAEKDHTRNQDDYDALYYDLDLDLNPTLRVLSGNVAARVEVLAPAVSTLDLNLRSNMTVSGATSGGLPASYSHVGHIVTIDLDRTYATGEIVNVSLTYSGNPEGGAFGWDSYGGQHMIWTLSEPFGARDWWPCKDLNSDKPDSVDIRVTVPDNLIVASNGELISDVDHGTTRTFHWHCGYPIATYLVSLAIHPYTVYSDWYTPLGGGDPMEVRFYVFPDHFDDVQVNYAKTVPMIGMFAQGFGEYPFLEEKYGHAEFVWGGGMEHQTITSLGGWSEDLISHELAHQWWGDEITCADFGHIWLNEGFATWCEAYWREQTEGFEVYQSYMNAAAYYGPGTIFVEDPLTEPIFDGNLSYNKGSWVVHMLRHVVGDGDFFAGLALYRSTYGYGSATTEQFRDVMEAVSGLDLDAFFEQWIYGEYFPQYRYTWEVGGGGSTVELVIEQIQTNTGLFTMPIDVWVETATDTTVHVVQNSDAYTEYSLPVSGDVQAVRLDPDRWILRRVETEVTNPTFAQGILLVNGVDWGSYGNEIYSAYEDSVFWGDNAITFWDIFRAPDGGYPANLPEPIGHGSVPPEILGQYSSLVWVGNNYLGDLPMWQETPILSYLEVGGNVLLMTRRGQSFLEGDLTAYLGITWAETGSSLGNCVATYPGLVNIPFTGSQSWNDVFLTSVGPNSTLLFKDTAGFYSDRGTGVHAQPPGGGTHRPDGAQFVHLAGRPYRMNHDALRANVEFILEAFFLEPYGQVGAPSASAPPRLLLEPGYPNPFNPRATIPFILPSAGKVELGIYNVAGRRVRLLVDGERPAGEQITVWNARDDAGRQAASGVYYIWLRTEAGERVRPLVLTR